MKGPLFLVILSVEGSNYFSFSFCLSTDLTAFLGHSALFRFGLVGYAASVAENNAEGQYLLQVTARDSDSGNNAFITYGFLEPAAQDFLSIHPQSGIVTARVSLDRERTPVLRYTLIAVDGGNNPRTGTAGWVIIVKV